MKMLLALLILFGATWAQFDDAEGKRLQCEEGCCTASDGPWNCSLLRRQRLELQPFRHLQERMPRGGEQCHKGERGVNGLLLRPGLDTAFGFRVFGKRTP